MSRQAATRATKEPEPTLPVGYRRDDVRVSHEGWSLEVPGSYAAALGGGVVGWRRRPEHHARGDDDGFGGRPADVGPAFIEQFAVDLGPDAMSHRAGESSVEPG